MILKNLRQLSDMHKRTKHQLNHLTENLPIAVGVVLVWRGIWELTDLLDVWAFNGSHTITAIGGIILGVFILYITDNELESLERL